MEWVLVLAAYALVGLIVALGIGMWHTATGVPKPWDGLDFVVLAWPVVLLTLALVAVVELVWRDRP
jgi:hypothetical protein